MNVGAKPAKSCSHPKVCLIEHAFPDGSIWRRCTACGNTWRPGVVHASEVAKRKAGAPVPPHYLKRIDATNWAICDWGKLKLTNFYDAEKVVQQWNAIADANGKPYRYRLPLHCNVCYHTCTETYEGGRCLKCCEEKGVAKPIIAKRQKGEIWTIDSALSPFGAKQWGYMGSAKDPYIVSQYKTKRDGSTTVDGWACGCMDFTRRTPRTHCKHILNVMLQEGLVPQGVGKNNVKAAKALAGVNDEQLEAFKKWQREQAEASEVKPEAGDASLNLFGSTGRKFR